MLGAMKRKVNAPCHSYRHDWYSGKFHGEPKYFWVVSL
jgi:hypothetical protein